MRDKEKKDILMNGLRDAIQLEMWPKMDGDDDYDQACDIAYMAEKIVLQKEISKNKSVKAVIAGICVNNDERDKQIQFLHTKVAKLEESQKHMKANSRTQSQDPLPTVAAIDTVQRDRSSSNGRPYCQNY